MENDKAQSAGLAGSIRRGKNSLEDKELGDSLLSDSKNLGEHKYVVEMIKKVFMQYCEDIKVPTRPKLMKIRDIQHLYSPIEGNLKRILRYSS